jgi:flagellar biosynthesis protein FlhG
MAITSGKGGVGKSNVTVNLAMALDLMGQRVLIIDADLGLANIDVLLGLKPRYNIGHVLTGEKQIEDVMANGPGNIRILPAASGINELSRLTDGQKLTLMEMFDGLDTEVDTVLIDTSSGISDTVLYFNLAAQERIVVITPDPASLLDAYALIKVLHIRHGERNFRILANSVKNEKEGKAIFAKISRVADVFLDAISLDYLGSLPYDSAVSRSVHRQRPVLELYPDAAVSKAFRLLAGSIQKTDPCTNYGTIQFFWRRLLSA